MMLGVFVISGKNLFTTTDLQESMKLIVDYKQNEYEIIVEAESKVFFSGSNL